MNGLKVINFFQIKNWEYKQVNTNSNSFVQAHCSWLAAEYLTSAIIKLGTSGKSIISRGNLHYIRKYYVAS